MQANAPYTTASYVISSADGSMLVALINGGIYISRAATPPFLKVAVPAGNVLLSWLVPSTSFVLEQTTNLTKTNWTRVTNAPTLNFTNLHYEVPVSRTNSRGFYRLKTP